MKAEGLVYDDFVTILGLFRRQKGGRYLRVPPPPEILTVGRMVGPFCSEKRWSGLLAGLFPEIYIYAVLLAPRRLSVDGNSFENGLAE